MTPLLLKQEEAAVTTVAPSGGGEEEEGAIADPNTELFDNSNEKLKVGACSLVHYRNVDFNSRPMWISV